ncbi:unnamed protein product [Camellia sinensis]
MNFNISDHQRKHHVKSIESLFLAISHCQEWLEGKVAVITGGASGIGEATARHFVRHGAKVIIADIQNTVVNSTSTESVSFVHCDVSNERDVEHAVDTAIAKHGKLDIMFSNAGIGGKFDRTIKSLDSQDLKRVFDVNVFGAFYCAKHAARAMIPNKKGSIVFTASVVSAIYGSIPHPYTASKNAVVGLAKNLCVELGKDGIRVNCISPHAVNTPILRNGLGMKEEKVEELVCESANLKGVRLEVEDVAEAVVYLGSDESKYMSGVNLLIDGGFSTTNPAFIELFNKMSS